MELNAEIENLNVTTVSEEEIQLAEKKLGDLMSTEGENEGVSKLEVLKRKMSFKA